MPTARGRPDMRRSLVAILAGYLTFATSAAAFFQLSGRDPHAAADPRFVVAATACGAAFALFGGYVAALLARVARVRHALAVGGLIAFGAVISLAAARGTGWSAWTALLLLAPSAGLGGWLRVRTTRGDGRPRGSSGSAAE